MQEMQADEVGRVEETNHPEETDEKSFVDESEERRRMTKHRAMLMLKQCHDEDVAADNAVDDAVDEEESCPVDEDDRR